MKIVKLPAEYVRRLQEGYHVVYGVYEYWWYLKRYVNDAWSYGYKRRHVKGGNVEEVKVVCWQWLQF